MILKSIELKGFKSFPDKTVLDFENGITAVVGPNGSGKSNISDAVRWVLGEQSTKTLRGSKMEDVIFSGTGKRSAKGFAEVSLKLLREESENKEDRELLITRRYYRSGVSDYLINNKNVRLKDINDTFMDTGLGKNGYSMVSQGQIAALISENPEKRREMIEEAVGISRFRYSRKEAERKLNGAEENLVRLRDIFSEIEIRIEPLKRQSEKAKKFISLLEEKKELEIGLWLHTINETDKKLSELDYRFEISENAYNEVKLGLENTSNEIERYDELQRELTIKLDELRRQKNAAYEQIKSSEAEIKLNKNEIEHNLDTEKRIAINIEEIKNGGDIAMFKIAETKKKAIDTEKKIKEIKLRKEVSEKILAEKAEKINVLNTEIFNIQNEFEELKNTVTDLRLAKENVSAVIGEIELRIKDAEQNIECGKSEKKEIDKTLNACILEIKEAEKQVESLSNSLDGYRLIFESKGKVCDELSKELEKIKNISEHYKAKIKALSELEKNMDGYYGSVKVVVKASKAGALKGIIGPVAKLISVPNGYSVAIETALGTALQNIVTEDENSAKSAIRFLQSERAGRATFLPVSAIHGRTFAENGLEDEYGFVGFANKLIKIDKRYSGIADYLLSRTVITDDLDSAVKIAKKYNYRFKIVTLDGQVINAGGSFTGGSTAKNSGVLSRESALHELKDKLLENENDYERILQEFKLASEFTASAKASYDGAFADLQRKKESVIRLSGNLEVINGKAENITNKIKEIYNEIEHLKERKISVVKNTDENEKEISRLLTEIEKVTNRRDELFLKKTDCDDKILKIKDDINEIVLNLELETKEYENLTALYKTLEDDFSDGESRINTLEEERIILKQKNIAFESKISSLKFLIDAGLEETENLESDILSTLSERDIAQKKITELRLSEKDKFDERERLLADSTKLQEKINSVKNEYDTLIQKLYDEYALTKTGAEEIGIVIENYSNANRRLVELRRAIKSLGDVNVSAIEEYKEVSERYTFLKKQINDVEKSKRELLKLIDELTDGMCSKFTDGFKKINEKFAITFAELFGGGKASLELLGSGDILNDEIDISIEPPGKRVKNLSLLSGGEKGLAAIALLVAILKINPAPFCVFDEVEAALDDVNVRRFAKYIKNMSKETQFIVITHRRGTMEEADVIYGVTMQEEGVSKLLVLNTGDAALKLGLIK